jgi:hypothetical protein
MKSMNPVVYTVAQYHDPYGYGAIINRTALGTFRLRIYTNGKTTYRREYKTWRGARRAMNRFCDIWYEDKNA